MTRYYTIENTSELSSLDFNELKTTSAALARKNLAGDKAMVAWEGTTPSALSSKPKYINSEIRAIVDDVNNGWYEED